MSGVSAQSQPPNQRMQPTAYPTPLRCGGASSRAAFQEVSRLCRVFGESILAVSHVRPAVVRAFPSRLACEVVSRVTSAGVAPPLGGGHRRGVAT